MVTDGQDKNSKPAVPLSREARAQSNTAGGGSAPASGTAASGIPASMSPSRLFVLRPVATTLLMVGVLLVGGVAFCNCRSPPCRRSIIQPFRS